MPTDTPTSAATSPHHLNRGDECLLGFAWQHNRVEGAIIKETIMSKVDARRRTQLCATEQPVQCCTPFSAAFWA